MCDHLTPADDHRHALSPGEHEAFYFPFTLPDGTVFGILRTLFGVDSVREIVALRIGERTWAHQQSAPLPKQDTPVNSCGPALELTCLEPWRSWRCRFHGPLKDVDGEDRRDVSIELTFTASAAAGFYQYGRYQQAQQDGWADGRLQVGADVWTTRFTCPRDRSWGQRAMQAEQWMLAAAPGGFYAFNVEFQGQWVCRGRFTTPDGRDLPVQALRVSAENDGWRIEDPEAGMAAWRVQRMGPPMVAHLRSGGEEAIRNKPEPGDVMRDEIGPALFTSPDGKQIVGVLEQARRIT